MPGPEAGRCFLGAARVVCQVPGLSAVFGRWLGAERCFRALARGWALFSGAGSGLSAVFRALARGWAWITRLPRARVGCIYAPC